MITYSPSRRGSDKPDSCDSRWRNGSGPAQRFRKESIPVPERIVLHPFQSVPAQDHSEARRDLVAAVASPRFGFNLSQIAIHAGHTEPGIQRKPSISSPSDASEREADDVANQVMRADGPTIVGSASAALQRKCQTCEDYDKVSIQAKLVSYSPTAAALDVDAAVRAAGRGGKLLPEETRSFFESRFRLDFSKVRIHDDVDAAQAARAVEARAYTVGHNIVFGGGEYSPATERGKQLLAHELTHVVQQTGKASTQNSPRIEKSIAPRTLAGGVVRLQRKPDDKGQEDQGAPKTSLTNCRENYLVESWEADTCCVNRGFLDAGAKPAKKGAKCCNTFPAFVDNEAVKRGYDGAASCRSPEFLNRRARVTPGQKGKTTAVDVLCVDTRRKKEAHVIELGFHAAQKAYGSTSVSDSKGTVCIGDQKEQETCFLGLACKPNPDESQCLAASCSKSDPDRNTREQDAPKP